MTVPAGHRQVGHLDREQRLNARSSH